MPLSQLSDMVKCFLLRCGPNSAANPLPPTTGVRNSAASRFDKTAPTLLCKSYLYLPGGNTRTPGSKFPCRQGERSKPAFVPA